MHVDSLLRSLRRRFRGATPLGLFLVATLALAGWLGHQALDAASSHRRTAEAVLRDYADISATELARVARANLDDVLDEVFGRVSRRTRGRTLPPAEAVGRDMDDAMKDQRCACPAFRSPLALLRFEAGGRGRQVVPDTLDPYVRDHLEEMLLARRPVRGRTGAGLFTTTAGGRLEEAVVVGYLVANDTAGVPDVAYGFVVTADALGELFRKWYEDRPLLPQPIAGDQPNDSLLHVSVLDAEGSIVFASPIGYPATLSASATLGPEYGDLTVQATVRPDAAARLIIGGLPNSRLPLLAMLLLLTLGVGIAAVVQLRREQTFQRLRDDFVSGVSHELRTPLAQIRMFAELQQSGKLRSEEDRVRAVHVIHRESRRLSHLVENILQFSRLRRTPEQGAPREELDLAGALADGIDAATPLLEDRGMRLTVDAREGLSVIASREALTRIIVNLLDNAVKYGPCGQTVTVAVERVNGAARLSVSDQGPGVPSADRDRVWKAYRRLERDVKARLPGTGIGLSVVRQLTAVHGGRTWIEDGVEGGARFVVELPLSLSPAGANGGPTPRSDA